VNVRRHGVRSVVVVLVCAAALGCRQDSASPRVVAPQDVARLASVSVGSDVALSGDDVAAVNVVGLQLVALGVPLRAWWSSLNDPAVAPSSWLQNSRGLAADMTATVDQLEATLGPERSPAVREALTPYVPLWREILRALEIVRTGVATNNTDAQLRGTEAYNLARGRIELLDQRRVARVVTAYGRDEARRLLADQGHDLERFVR
jgi:hypothetical protein